MNVIRTHVCSRAPGLLGELAGVPAALRRLSRSRVMEGRNPAHQRKQRLSCPASPFHHEEKMHVSNNRRKEQLGSNKGARCSKRRGNLRLAGAMLHVPDSSVRCGCVREGQGQKARHSDAQLGRQRVCREQEPIHDDAERLGRQDMACGDAAIQSEADARRDLIVPLAALTRPWLASSGSCQTGRPERRASRKESAGSAHAG